MCTATLQARRRIYLLFFFMPLASLHLFVVQIHWLIQNSHYHTCLVMFRNTPRSTHSPLLTHTWLGSTAGVPNEAVWAEQVGHVMVSLQAGVMPLHRRMEFFYQRFC